jgi:hypothetical protein
MSEACQDAQVIQEKKGIKRSKFTSEEDEQIRALVAQFGPNAWDAIAGAMNGQRNKRQLRERWLNYLNPDHDVFYTENEDQALVGLYARTGPQWAKIASVIGTKSAISVRNRYRSLQSMRARGLKPDYQILERRVKLTQNPVSEPPAHTFAEFDVQFTNVGIVDSWEWDIDSCL